MNSSITTVRLDLVRLNHDVWPRFEIDYDRARLFAELYRDQGPDALPPPEVVSDGQRGFYVADGVHRIGVMRDVLGLKQATVILLGIPTGRTPEQVAYERALETSSHAAKALSRAERNAAVCKLIEQRPDLSDREVGRLAGVSHQTVARRRSDQEEPPDRPGSSLSTTRAQSPEKRLSRLIKQVIEQTETTIGVGDQTVVDQAGSAQRFASALGIAYGDEALDHARRLQRWVAHTLATLGDEGR